MEKLTEDEIYCLIQHYSVFCNLEVQHKKATTEEICGTCAKLKQCAVNSSNWISYKVEAKLPKELIVFRWRKKNKFQRFIYNCKVKWHKVWGYLRKYV